MSGYNLIERVQIDKHITFIRIEIIDVAISLKEIFKSLSDLAWITSFDEEYTRLSYEVRAEDTVKYIAENIIKKKDNKITSDSGEIVVSELARMAIVTEMKYLDIPLAELIKSKNFGNHRFDFYSKNHNPIILFGEAKYLANQNAYGKSFEQIARFVTEERDINDLNDIDRFCCNPSKANFAKGKKGFMAAFATKSTSTDKLIKGIKANTNYKKLVKYNELICITVNI